LKDADRHHTWAYGAAGPIAELRLADHATPDELLPSGDIADLVDLKPTSDPSV